VRRVAAAALLVVASLACALAMLPSAARAAGCDTLEYLTDIHTAAAAAAAGDAPGALRAVRAAESIDSATALFLAPVVADLTASPADTDDARSRLDAVDRTLALPPGAACAVAGTDARDSLQRVYALPEFSGLDQTTQPSVFDQIVRAIGQLISRAASTLGVAGGAAVLAILVVAAVLLVLWRLRAAGAAHVRDALLEDALVRGTDPDDEWRAALAAAERGEYRQAMRRAFRSALLEMVQRGRLRVDPAWTTRELLTAAAGDADLVAQLAPAAALFDRAWYSRAQAGAPEWELMRSRCEAIRRLAARRPREQPV